ncbi:glycosyltransferase [bacterium]|nr:glycosyltransferase [bacterium]
MHIGIATDTFLPRVNGVMKSIMTFTEQFRSMGHKVTIFAPRFPEAKVDEEDLWRFPSFYLFFNPEDRLPNPYAGESKRKLKAIADLKLDIMHTQTPFTLGYMMARRCGKLNIPLVHTYHTMFEAYMPHYFPILPRVFDKPFVGWFSRRCCNLHDAVVVPSTSIAEVMKDYKVKPPVKVIPTGINIEPFRNVDGARMRKKLGFADDEKILLSMGRVAGEKNIPFLFDVLQKLESRQPRARLVIAGQGPALESVKADCKKRKLDEKVMFIGLLNRKDWADLYAAADLQLLASVTETQGLVLTEAMAAGTPCVAVAAMGVRDVMAAGGGIAVSLNVDEFTDAVNRLLTDEKLYQEKLVEAKKQATEWSARSKAEQMLANYETVIAAKKAQG